jgi:uncharacterized membrane protein
MDGAWQTVKWVWVAVCFVWLIVQSLAFRRLKGDLKRRSTNVFWVVFILMMVSDFIRDVFENREASRIAMLSVGIAAIVATILLVRMFGQRPVGPTDDQARTEDYIQPLKLG